MSCCHGGAAQSTGERFGTEIERLLSGYYAAVREDLLIYISTSRILRCLSLSFNEDDLVIYTSIPSFFGAHRHLMRRSYLYDIYICISSFVKLSVNEADLLTYLYIYYVFWFVVVVQ